MPRVTQGGRRLHDSHPLPRIESWLSIEPSQSSVRPRPDRFSYPKRPAVRRT